MTEQRVGSSEDYRKQKANSCVTANIYITGKEWVSRCSDSGGIYSFQSYSNNYKTQIQLSCINLSPFLLSTGKLRNHASCKAETETQIAATSVLEAPQNELSISLMVTHVINDEKVYINSPMGQMNDNCLSRCWIVI